MPETAQPQGASQPAASRAGHSMSLRAAVGTVKARRRFVLSVVGGLLLLCLLYCLIVPNQYEAKARVALRVDGGEVMNTGTRGQPPATSALMGQAEVETLAQVFRSDQLAWRVILERKLYAEPALNGWFDRKFPHFNPAAPDPDAQAYLLERFQRRLHVGTVPRTLLVEIRFRTHSAVVSSDVVNALIRTFVQQQSDSRRADTGQAVVWLETQLAELKAKADDQDRKIAEFEKKNGILIAPEDPGKEQSGQHLSAMTQVDELSKELVTATSERILREAEYRAAMQGDPELALASDPHLENENSNLSASIFRQIRARRIDLQQEMAQLSLEHGPNYSRVAEIRQQLADLDKQLQAENTKLRESLRGAWQTAIDREQMVKRSLEVQTGQGFSAVAAMAQYEVMRHEADATRDLYISTEQKVRQAGLEAGAHPADIWVVDPARPPAKPAAPNLPLYMAITLFVALWLAFGGAFLMESWKSSGAARLVALLLICMAGLAARAQAPTYTTSGLPQGVTKMSQSSDTRITPNPQEAPPVWNGTGTNTGPAPTQGGMGAAPVPGKLGPGDLLEVSEFHSPEFHSTVRVSQAGTVTLPMIGEIKVGSLAEADASKAIAAALMEKGMLLHPQVFILVTQYAAQDVSVLGEVTHPGVYPYTAHHRLLDLIAAASGVSQAAGSVVSIYKRDTPDTTQLVALSAQIEDKNAAQAAERNPELEPGDTIQVSRAQLVYVVGDVIRPGGFTVDPAQQLTVLQALTLAWGPSQNASAQKALLIREQSGGGRTVTELNLKRMLRGQDPDQPIHERDILYVPDSMAKNILNRSLESLVQSAVGVSIYAGLVYSQRF
ncbi:polysaccharide biosynthesis/export family protein [Terracidiphilus gabretensis]|uniref:polysaccharide biosynthesis/export family protein n=1 Tax=Terracidiphilus gabretensis TaxID=1577687 RepID=UPI000A47BDBF|nr:polysaccharide biosynthesis/export family protein [Terracidiphilus gabretensis]